MLIKVLKRTRGLHKTPSSFSNVGLGGVSDTCPGPTLTEPCIKANTFFGEILIFKKMLTFQKILGYSRAKKLCAQIPT